MNKQKFRYYTDEGKGIPSVTELLKWIPKPYLIKWANKLGFQGTTYDEASEYYTTIGDLVHKCNEIYIKNNSVRETLDQIQIPDNISTIVLRCFGNFISWYKENKDSIEVLHNELSIKTEEYAGTIDFIFKKGDDIYIMDFKSSSQISVDYFIQLCAYYKLCKSKDIHVTKVAVLRQDKYDKEFDYKEYDIQELLDNKYLEMFESIIKCYNQYNHILEHYKNKKRKIN